MLGMTVCRAASSQSGCAKIAETTYDKYKTQAARKIDLHLPVRSAQHQNPHQNRRDRHGNIFADVKDLHRRRDAGKFRHDVRQIDEKSRDHHEKRRPESKFLANQIR